jgi:hypothetical protein
MFTKSLTHVFAPDQADPIGTYEVKSPTEVWTTSHMPHKGKKQAYPFASVPAAMSYIKRMYERSAAARSTSDNSNQLMLSL